MSGRDAAGQHHLEGATNIDAQATTFASRFAKLDKNTPYFLYCHSGNRAGQAITAMKAVGFTHLTNGGGITAAAQTSGPEDRLVTAGLAPNPPVPLTNRPLSLPKPWVPLPTPSAPPQGIGGLCWGTMP